MWSAYFPGDIFLMIVNIGKRLYLDRLSCDNWDDDWDDGRRIGMRIEIYGKDMCKNGPGGSIVHHNISQFQVGATSYRILQAIQQPNAQFTCKLTKDTSPLSPWAAFATS